MTGEQRKSKENINWNRQLLQKCLIKHELCIQPIDSRFASRKVNSLRAGACLFWSRFAKGWKYVLSRCCGFFKHCEPFRALKAFLPVFVSCSYLPSCGNLPPPCCCCPLSASFICTDALGCFQCPFTFSCYFYADPARAEGENTIWDIVTLSFLESHIMNYEYHGALRNWPARIG